MMRLLLVVLAVLTGALPVTAQTAAQPNHNTLANFITVKEFTHCAAFHLVDLKARGLQGAERENGIKIAGAFVAAALRIDQAFAETALPYAQRYMARLAHGDRVSRYRQKCGRLINDHRYRTRMYDWRYRLNASLPVPAAFFEMRWDGPLPAEWYGE